MCKDLEGSPRTCCSDSTERGTLRMADYIRYDRRRSFHSGQKKLPILTPDSCWSRLHYPLYFHTTSSLLPFSLTVPQVPRMSRVLRDKGKVRWRMCDDLLRKVQYEGSTGSWMAPRENGWCNQVWGDRPMVPETLHRVGERPGRITGDEGRGMKKNRPHPPPLRQNETVSGSDLTSRC